MSRRRLGIVVICGAAAVLPTIWVVAGAGSAETDTSWNPAGPKPARSVPAVDGLKACPGDGRLNFAHFYLGSRFEGLPLEAVLRNCDRPAEGEPYPGRTNVITFVYGKCRVPKTHDGGCMPPLEVTSAPACEDNLSLYYRYPDVNGRPPPHRRLRIRSTQAASFESGRQLEIYTGDATVTIAGDHPRQVRRAAQALRSGPPGLRVALNSRAKVGAGVSSVRKAAASAATSSGSAPRAISAGAPVPQPARGAMAGKLRC